MEITIKQILEADEALKNLVSVKLPIKVSYKLKRLLDKLTPEIKSFEEQKLEIFKELGEIDPETDNYTIKKENKEEAVKKLNELGELEVKIDFEKIKLEELGEMNIEAKNLVTWVFEV